MKSLLLCLCTAALYNQSIYGQASPPHIYLNHIYIVLDSNTYFHLFDSDLITQQLGNSKTGTVTTTGDSWSGKYLYGKNGYFEFFSTKGLQGSTVGDCGLAFMTFKSNDIWEIERKWNETTSDSIEIDTTAYISEGKTKPWFYSINLLTNDQVEELSVWVMENTPDELTRAGFSGEEIKNPLLWQEYMEKVSHKPFTKSFNHIKSVHLSINEAEYEYLKFSLKGFGLQHKRNLFFNDHLKIVCSIVQNPLMRIKSIELELSERCPKRRIQISERLHVHVKGNKAIWEFKY